METMTELREQLYTAFRESGMSEQAARLAADIGRNPLESGDLVAQFEQAARQQHGLFGPMSEAAAQAYTERYRADYAAARLAEPRQTNINRNTSRLHEQNPAGFSPRHEELVKRSIRNRRQEGKINE